MTHCRRRLAPALTLALGLVLTAVAAPAETQADKLFLWRVQAGGTTSYLMGSIHLMKEGMYPLDPVVERAFARADVLVLELDPAAVDHGKMMRLMQTRGMYPAGKSIRDDLDPEVYSMLQTEAGKLGLPMVAVQRMRPGLATISITTAKLMKLGYKPEHGVDNYFTKKKGSKKVVGLETMEEQMELIFGMPNDSLLMKQTLVELKDMEEVMDKTVAAWEEGDTATLKQLMFTRPLKEHPELAPVYKRVFSDRNATMAQKIEKLLNKEQSHFIVVGAGHLLRADGIIALLNKAGSYTVEQLEPRADR